MVVHMTSQLIHFEDPSANEYLDHPDFHQIATFFLGWVFMSSLYCLCSSPFSRYIAKRVLLVLFHRGTSNAVADIEGSSTLEAAPPADEKAHRRANDVSYEMIFSKYEYPALVFTLTLLFVLASIAQFASLLSFSPTSGEASTTCAFVVAWGGMSSQTARLVGLLVLGCNLRNIGAKHWEIITLSVWLVIGTVFVFVANAIGIGTLKIVQEPLNIALCYRIHFLPTALVSSLISISLELYCLIRFFSLIVTPDLRFAQQLVNGIQDIRIVRAISLLVFDLLTVVPNGVQTNILGDFLPYSIGALLVIGAYNYPSAISKPINTPVTAIPRSTRTPPVLSISRHASLDFLANMQAHPFSANSLRDETLQPDQWSRKPRLSILDRDDEAVIQTARRQSPQPARLILPPPTMRTAGTGLISPRSASGKPPRLLQMRQILPNQVQFARQFEELQSPDHPHSHSSRQKISIVTSPDVSGPPNVNFDSLSPGSIDGSDIIQSTPNQKAMRISGRVSRQTFGNTHRESEIPPSARSMPRYSTSLWPMPPEFVLSAVREGSSHDSTEFPDASRAKGYTFGEADFTRANFQPPMTPPLAATFSAPSYAAEPRGSYPAPRSAGLRPDGSPKIKGPRPPRPSERKVREGRIVDGRSFN